MKVAISTDGNQVSMHFGRCPEYTIVEIQDGKVVNRETIMNPGHQSGFLPGYLSNIGVSRIVAGGMGHRAFGLFQEQGVKPIIGVSGSIDEVINKLVKGTLEGGENICRPGLGKGYGLDKTKE